jgi:hypothetical protein
MTAQEASKLLSGRVLVPRKTAALPEGITVAELRKLDIPPGTIIVGACFSCETPDSVIFPDKMRGVRFLRCNLDNVLIPPGNPELGENTGTTMRRFRMNPDDPERRDCEVDKQGKFLAPLSESAREA